MLKLIGVVMIFFAGTCTGLYASIYVNHRAASLEQMERLIVYLETQIRYSAAPIRDMILRASSGEFSKLTFLSDAVSRMNHGESPVQAWGGAVRIHGEDCAFNKEDRGVLIDFGRGLGCSDISGQLSHCENFKCLIDDRLQKARTEAQTKGKLYITLGIAAGLGIALLLY